MARRVKPRVYGWAAIKEEVLGKVEREVAEDLLEELKMWIPVGVDKLPDKRRWHPGLRLRDKGSVFQGSRLVAGVEPQHRVKGERKGVLSVVFEAPKVVGPKGNVFYRWGGGKWFDYANKNVPSGIEVLVERAVEGLIREL